MRILKFAFLICLYLGVFNWQEATASLPYVDYDTIPARNAELDSILTGFNRKIVGYKNAGISELEMQVYIKGRSKAVKRGHLCRWIPDLLPFEAGTKVQYFEALCQVSYKKPCYLQITPIAFHSTNRKGRKLLKEVYQLILPSYDLLQQDNRNNASFVLPFSNYGLKEYKYEIKDTIYHDNGQKLYRIAFIPNRKHHILLKGSIVIDPIRLIIYSIQCNGKIDFGSFSTEINYKNYNDTLSIPSDSHIELAYNYANNKGYNTYDCTFRFNNIKDSKNWKEKEQNLDLTSFYQTNLIKSVDWDSIRPAKLDDMEAMALTPKIQTTSQKQKTKELYETIPKKLFSTSRINAFGTNLHVSGPLDPASIGIDKFNGFTMREKLRLSHEYNDGRSLLVKPEFAYCFGIKEFRYKFNTEWIYWPERRGGLSLSASNRSSGFSSKFIKEVNDKLDSLGTKFDDIGIDYYHMYDYKIENAYEITNGLMLYLGTSYTYRTPVKRGHRAISEEHLNALVKSKYADFSPYFRLTWTPRQYYHYDNRQKLYIASLYPTFSLEFAQGINNVFHSSSDYSRLEFDVQQAIKIDPLRTLSYHVGFGGFFNQRGEYFVNYRYFARNQYPSSWDDHIGGTFNLLDDYWYSSTPGYFQSHVMFETPFMLLHKAKWVSKYVIKERIYVSTLYAHKKNAYTEWGYGMGNNYFNVGAFCGFIGFGFFDFGFKASIEIDQHW